MTPKILGLDLSLTATGLAGNAGWTETLKPPTKLRDTDRLDWILRTITGNFLAGVDLAVVEGPAYSQQAGQAGHHERAGLWWLVRVTLAHRHIPTAVITPGGVKKYATGKGVGSKDAIVLAAARRFPWFDGDNNAADALFLAAAGADHLGCPMVTMPATHRAALDAVKWPEMPAQPAESAAVGLAGVGGYSGTPETSRTAVSTSEDEALMADLPGMWEAADFTGGLDEVRGLVSDAA